MEPRVNILSLILDDDRDIHQLIEEVLKDNKIENYRIYEKVDEFYNNLSSKDMHICAIDYYLDSKYTGLDVLKEIKKRNKHSCVIIISGLKNPEIIIECLNQGASFWVDKNQPNYLNTLVEFMNKSLHSIQARLALISFIDERQREKIDLDKY